MENLNSNSPELKKVWVAPELKKIDVGTVTAEGFNTGTDDLDAS